MDMIKRHRVLPKQTVTSERILKSRRRRIGGGGGGGSYNNIVCHLNQHSPFSHLFATLFHTFNTDINLARTTQPNDIKLFPPHTNKSQEAFPDSWVSNL